MKKLTADGWIAAGKTGIVRNGFIRLPCDRIDGIERDEHMRVLNIGSLNIDHVYRVDHVTRPGETIVAQSYSRFAGGKGANQSVAIARAGCPVIHIGKIGREGRWMIENMEKDGVDVSRVVVSEEPGGHAVIQVDTSGQNTIVVFGGTNCRISKQEVDGALAGADKEDLVLLQNEINLIPYIIEQAAAKSLPIVMNPAPINPSVLEYPLDKISTFIINEQEGKALTGRSRDGDIIDEMLERFPNARIILTLGKRGLIFAGEGKRITLDIERDVSVVDTTGAGDTFIGYYTAAVCMGRSVEEALAVANLAASYCVSRPGASASIPWASDLTDF